MDNKIDFFISHASEDKQDIVKKLADNLIINGASVFYDEYSIRLGDSISESINRGLTVSNHAIVILSKYFFDKGWTNAELQAIFNKSISNQYKILIVYHGITHADVVERYPLLADKKAVDSSIGIEKITESLFSAIDKSFNLQYIKHELGRTRDVSEGFSVSMVLGFPNRLNTGVNKTIYEMGEPNIHHSRLKLYLWKYEKLYFEITDSKYRKYSIAVDFNKWASTETHYLHACLDVKTKTMRLIVDDDVQEEIRVPDLYLESDFLKKGLGILGCSLNLSDPCPLLVATHSTGASGIDSTSQYKSIMTLLKSLQSETKG